MKKKVFSFLFTIFLFIVSFFFIVNNLKAATFVPCDTDDVLCQLDCDLNGNVCGYWIDDTPVDNCPVGQKLHPTSGNCIYENDAACRDRFGEAYYDGNEIDGCVCVEGTIYSHETWKCEFPNNCPAGQKLHPTSGNCIYEDDAACRARFGEAYYDGNETDGCACIDGAVWDGYVCFLELDFDIKIDPLQFTLSADGESQQEISAWVENENGEKVSVPMWIQIQTPNNIRSGKLNISSGKESNKKNFISATYISPYIENIEKDEDNDIIEDLIYIFAEINGETKYKVIEAILETQGTDFDVSLQFEKDGLVTRTIKTIFNEGALSGSAYFLDEDEEYDPNGVKVILDGTLANAKQDKIHLETFTQNGTFFFENLGKTGELILDPIELTMDENDYSYYDKYYKNKDKFVERVSKYGADVSFLLPYTNIVENYSEYLADAKFDEAQEVIDSLKMSAYTAYFFEFYGRKADESLDNFVNYMSNILVDTISLMQGIVNVTGAVFDAAGDSSSASGQVLAKWLAKKNNVSKLQEIGQKGLKTILNTLRKGLSFQDQESQRVMNAFQDLIGGLESYLFADGLDIWKHLGPKQIKKIFANYMKRGYVSDMAKIAKKYKVNLENIPNNVDKNIKTAENLFIKNTEDHDYRNSLQYEWDVDTSALTEFINVMKPAAKVALSVYLANPVIANDVVDKAGNAFNALKVAASMNHTYEWYALYQKDFEYLEKSLSILNTGKELSYINNLEIPIKTTVLENKFTLIKTVKAEVMENKISNILSNILLAVQNNDNKSLADNLDKLDKLRENNNILYTDNIDYINQYSSYLNEENNEKAVDTLIANSDLNFISDLIDLYIVNLVLDPSEENIENFSEIIESFVVIENDLTKDNIEVYNLISNLDLEKQNSKVAKNAIEDNSLGIYISDIFLLLFYLTLVIGSIVTGIIFKKKGKKAGFISLGITVSLLLLLLFLTEVFYDYEII